MEKNKITPIKGQDMSAPVRHIRWNGKEYPMVFSNRAVCVAEDIYAEVYDHPEMGWYDIIREVSVPKHRALLAVAYASLRAGGADVEWPQFVETFRMADLMAATDKIADGIAQSMPDPEEDDGKNPEATPMA